MRKTKRKEISLFLMTAILFSNAHAQLIEETPDPLSITNAVEIGDGIAGELLEKTEENTSRLERHLIFDASSGEFKGVFRDTNDGRVYLFDSKGFLNLILRKKDTSTVNIFDTHGKWLYVVKNGMHVFNRTGQRVGTLRTSNERIVLIKTKHPRDPAQMERID